MAGLSQMNPHAEGRGKVNKKNQEQKQHVETALVYLSSLMALTVFYWLSANWPDIKRGVVDGFLCR